MASAGEGYDTGAPGDRAFGCFACPNQRLLSRFESENPGPQSSGRHKHVETSWKVAKRCQEAFCEGRGSHSAPIRTEDPRLGALYAFLRHCGGLKRDRSRFDTLWELLDDPDAQCRLDMLDVFDPKPSKSI